MNGNALPGKIAGTNRHPVDQLANVRATIKTLQEREAQLKEQIVAMMGDDASIGGDEFIASLRPGSRKGGLDEKRLAEHFGDLSMFRKPDSAFKTLTVEPRALEGL